MRCEISLSGLLVAAEVEAGVWNRFQMKSQRRRALGEIERLLAIDRMAHFPCMVLVIAADAENARDREKNVKAGALINGARVALTGQGVAPSLFAVMANLGQERTVARLKRAREIPAGGSE